MKLITKLWREIVYPSGQNYFSSQTFISRRWREMNGQAEQVLVNPPPYGFG